ncbi:MAG: AMP-binding protein [Flavobacteriaceae bacterium]
MKRFFDSLERDARVDGTRPVLIDGEGPMSRGELLAAVSGMAEALRAAPRVIAILAPNGRDWVIAQLAAIVAGKTFVPLPTFFSAGQIAHILDEASVDAVLVDATTRSDPRLRGIPTLPIDRSGSADATLFLSDGFEQIIYTSGSTGEPKGVRHSGSQIASIVNALAAATDATGKDRYLSILPLPMLLETICAIFIPLLVGARVTFDRVCAEQIFRGDVAGVAASFARHRPTASVLVPDLLRAFVAQLEATQSRAPSSLRYVAVGGAPVSEHVAARAWDLGIPVHEGYGLSECCSVVSLNRPGHRRGGTVGRPIRGLTVVIENGEIVVAGPTVMDGYLGASPAPKRWRTGDLGSFDHDGFLTIHGRKDNRIVTAMGRNISPEWVETALLADHRIAVAAVTIAGGSSLTVVLIPSVQGEAWFSGADETDVRQLIRACCAKLPDYAIPDRHVVVGQRDAVAAMLLTRGGRIIRCHLADFITSRVGAPIHGSSPETTKSTEGNPDHEVL